MEALRIKPRVLHVLRSVVLAGAGAVVWMALSSTAANADSGSTNHTILGGADSAVTNVVHDVTAGLSKPLGDAVSAGVASTPAPAAAPAPAVPVPAVQVPAVVVGELPQLTQTIDHVVASTPVADVTAPGGTVGAVTAPVVSPAANAVDGVGSSVGSMVGGVVAPALGALGSTVDALPVDGLPVTILGLPVAIPPIQLSGGVWTGEAPSEAHAVLVPVDASTTYAVLPLAKAVAAPLLGLTGRFGLPGPGRAPWNPPAWTSGSGDPSVPGSPPGGTFPNGFPGSSDAGNGSAALPSNPSGAAAAWLPGMNLFHPFAGILMSTAAAGRVPAPVSFDPGSSPD